MIKWRNFRPTSLILGAAFGLLSLALMGSEARAGILQITISEGATSYTILDEGPLDTLIAPPPDNVNKIQALAAALVFPDYKIVGLNASTNNPGDANSANLIVGGEVQKLTSGSAPALIITVTDTDYNAPANPRLMQSITSSQFTGEPSGTKTFQSWYNPTNNPYDKVIPQSALPQSYTSTGPTLNGLVQTSGELPVPPSPLYGLTNETRITMGTAGGDLVFGGSTLVTSAIPEPASMSLMALGLPVAIWGWMRRRRASHARA